MPSEYRNRYLSRQAELLVENVPTGNLSILDRSLHQINVLSEYSLPWNKAKWHQWIERIDPEGTQNIEAQLNKRNRFVYFSAEYGLPGMGFNGGLGVLSGDHYLEALAINQPGIFIGLGYDRRKKQTIQHNSNNQYWQSEETEPIPSAQQLGFKKAEKIEVVVNDPDGAKHYDVYKYSLGNEVTTLYRIGVGGEVYPGDTNCNERLRHNAALGFGGYQIIRQLQEQDIIDEPPKYHLNESATVLGALAILDDNTQKNIVTGLRPYEALKQALKYVSSRTLLTNHTLVPAAQCTLSAEQCQNYIMNNLQSEEVKNWLRNFMSQRENRLSLNDLALQLAGKYNGVSKFHAKLATESFSKAYGDTFGRPIEFDPVTNGIFAQRWNKEIYAALQKNRAIDPSGLPPDDLNEFQRRIDELPLEEMIDIKAWSVHKFGEYLKAGNKLDQFSEIADIPEDAIIIGEARRVAGYKRRWMLFQNIPRLEKMLKANPNVHIVLAGKAHPEDKVAKDQLAYVLNIIKDNPLFEERIHFLVDYDVELAQYMEPAVHIWVNTPEVGKEACGTSGMKAGLEATLVSTKDGFYAELSPGSYYTIEGETNSPEEFDSFYTQLETATRDAQDLEMWAGRVKELWKGGLLHIAMGTRMLREYTQILLPPQLVEKEKDAMVNDDEM